MKNRCRERERERGEEQGRARRLECFCSPCPMSVGLGGVKVKDSKLQMCGSMVSYFAIFFSCDVNFLVRDAVSYFLYFEFKLKLENSSRRTKDTLLEKRRAGGVNGSTCLSPRGTSEWGIKQRARVANQKLLRVKQKRNERERSYDSIRYRQ
jgi:hypothetical protein